MAVVDRKPEPDRRGHDRALRLSNGASLGKGEDAKAGYACVVRREVLFLASSFERAVQWCRQYAADTHTPDEEIRLFTGDMNAASRRPRESKWNERYAVTVEDYENKTGIMVPEEP